MKISTRSEYGLRALIELGSQPDRGLSLRDIAKRQKISLDYLEQIAHSLKAAGLVRARRGAQGGYQLARSPHDITVYDALVALEGPLVLMMCLSESLPEQEGSGCMASGSCVVQEVWREMTRAVETVLKRLTLGQLLERQQSKYGAPIRTYSDSEIMQLVVLN